MKALSLLGAVLVVVVWAAACPAQVAGDCCPCGGPAYTAPSYGPSGTTWAPGYGDAVASPSDVYRPVVAPRYVYRPVVPLAPMPGEFQVGQGILGQPKLYVPGQPVRNFLRYLTP